MSKMTFNIRYMTLISVTVEILQLLQIRLWYLCVMNAEYLAA